MGTINGGSNQPGLGIGTPLYSAAVSNGAAQVQTLTPTGTISGGTFSLTLYGETTAALAYNASAVNIAAALNALTCVGATGVSVAGAGNISGTAMLVTFGTSTNGVLWGADIPLLVVNSGLTGSSPLITPTISTPAGLATHRFSAPGAICILNDGSSGVKVYQNVSQIIGKPAWQAVGAQS